MTRWTRARACTVFGRRKAKEPRTITLEHPVQAATILTWTLITRRLVGAQLEVPGMEGARAVRSIAPRMRYPRRSLRTRGRAGSCSPHPHPLHLSQHLSHLRRSKHIKAAPHLLTCFRFVTGLNPRFRLIYFLLLLESPGSSPPLMQMRHSIWTNMGTSTGNQCGRRS